MERVYHKKTLCCGSKQSPLKTYAPCLCEAQNFVLRTSMLLCSAGVSSIEEIPDMPTHAWCFCLTPDAPKNVVFVRQRGMSKRAKVISAWLSLMPLRDKEWPCTREALDCFPLGNDASYPLLCAAKLHILLVQPDKNVVFVSRCISKQ